MVALDAACRLASPSVLFVDGGGGSDGGEGGDGGGGGGSGGEGGGGEGGGGEGGGGEGGGGEGGDELQCHLAMGGAACTLPTVLPAWA